MKAKLVVVGGEAKAAEINLHLPTIIGRGRDATLTLPHPLVSRQHCEIYEAQGQLRVKDLGSLNGTFIANERVTDEVLPPGELLTIGTVTFRAVYDAETPDMMPPASLDHSPPRGNRSIPGPRWSCMRRRWILYPLFQTSNEWGEIDTDDVAQLPDADGRHVPVVNQSIEKNQDRRRAGSLRERRRRPSRLLGRPSLASRALALPLLLVIRSSCRRISSHAQDDGNMPPMRLATQFHRRNLSWCGRVGRGGARVLNCGSLAAMHAGSCHLPRG